MPVIFKQDGYKFFFYTKYPTSGFIGRTWMRIYLLPDWRKEILVSIPL